MSHVTSHSPSVAAGCCRCGLRRYSLLPWRLAAAVAALELVS